MRALVTGADGFVGRYLVDLLTSAGNDVTESAVDITDRRRADLLADNLAVDLTLGRPDDGGTDICTCVCLARFGPCGGFDQ